MYEKWKKKRKIDVHFLAHLVIPFDEIQSVATTCWFVEAHAKILHKYWTIQERELCCWCDTFNIDLRNDSCEMIDLFQTWYDAKHY